MNKPDKQLQPGAYWLVQQAAWREVWYVKQRDGDILLIVESDDTPSRRWLTLEEFSKIAVHYFGQGTLKWQWRIKWWPECLRPEEPFNKPKERISNENT